MRSGARPKQRREDISTGGGGVGGGDGDGDGGPPQLRQQSYVGPRPGAYWAAPGAAMVRAPSPAPLPPPRQGSAADYAPNPDTRQAAPSHPRRPLPPREPEVTLEAEPVRSIIVTATPVTAEVPKPDSEPPPAGRSRPKRRTCFILLAVVAVVAAAAAAAAAGVVVGTSAGRRISTPAPAPSAATAPTGGSSELPAPSSRPTAPPSAAPPSSAPSTDSSLCRPEHANFSECLGLSGGGASECESCVASYYTNVLRLNVSADAYLIPCEEIDDETCDALSSCAGSCSSCAQEFIAYFECESLCSLAGTNCSDAAR